MLNTASPTRLSGTCSKKAKCSVRPTPSLFLPIYGRGIPVSRRKYGERCIPSACFSAYVRHMYSASLCKCTSSCPHHRGATCGNLEHILKPISGFGEPLASHPLALGYCIKCLHPVAQSPAGGNPISAPTLPSARFVPFSAMVFTGSAANGSTELEMAESRAIPAKNRSTT